MKCFFPRRSGERVRGMTRRRGKRRRRRRRQRAGHRPPRETMLCTHTRSAVEGCLCMGGHASKSRPALALEGTVVQSCRPEPRPDQARDSNKKNRASGDSVTLTRFPGFPSRMPKAAERIQHKNLRARDESATHAPTARRRRLVGGGRRRDSGRPRSGRPRAGAVHRAAAAKEGRIVQG